MSNSPSARRAFPALFVALMLGSVPLHAGDGIWTQIGPESGYVGGLQVVADDPDTVYGRTSAGIVRSRDGGQTWMVLLPPQGNGVSELVVDPIDSDRLYAVEAFARLLISTDGGASFSVRHVVSAEFNLAHLATGSDGSILYAGAAGMGVAISTDRGITWQLRSTGLPTISNGHIAVSELWASPTNPAVAYVAVRDSGLYRTTDAGLSWTHLSGLPLTQVLAFDASATDPNLLVAGAGSWVYRSTDGGTVWALVLNQVLPMDIAIHPTNDNIIYSGGIHGDLHRSTDRGLTWTAITDAAGALSMRSIALQGTRVLLGTSLGVKVSDDGGSSFDPGSGIHSGTPSLLFQDPISHLTWFLSFDEGGLHRTTDGGATWSLAQTGMQRGGGMPAVMLRAMTRGADGTLYAAGSDIGIYHSTDGGDTWARRSSQFVYANITINVYDLAAHPTDPGLLYAATSDGLFKTSNGGLTWTATGPASFATNGVQGVTVSPHDGNLVLAGSWLSRDAGATWTSMQISARRHRFDPVDPNIIFAFNRSANSTISNIRLSRDAGATWDYLLTGATAGGADVGISRDGSERLFVTNLSGPQRSVDGGVSYETLTTGLYTQQYNRTQVLAMDRSGGARFLIGLTSGGLMELQVRPDLRISLGSAPSQVVIGVPFTAAVSIGNTATLRASGVSLSVELPAGVVLHSAEGATCAGETGVVTCTVGTIAASAEADLALSLEAQTLGAKQLRLSVAGYEEDPDSGNDSVSHSLTSHGSADLGITLAGPTTNLLTGQALTFIATLSNAGPHAATSPRIDVVLPGGSSFSGADGATCSQVGASLTCTTADLAVGESRSLSFELSLLAPGANGVTASLSSAALDPSGVNDVASVDLTLRGRADLRLRFSAPSPGEITTGQRATYDSVVTNLGPDPATNLAINYVVPSGASSVSATGATCQASGVTVGCTLATLGSGSSVAIPVAMNLSTTGTMTLSGSATASEADADSGNNADSSSVGVSRPTTGADLTVAVTGGAASIQVNKTTTYSFSVTNTGPQATTGGTFTFSVPALLTGSSIKADKPIKCTKGAVMRCTLTAMTVGQTVRGTIKLKAKKTPGTATMTATVTGSPADFDSSNNTATRSLTITPKG